MRDVRQITTINIAFKYDADLGNEYINSSTNTIQVGSNGNIHSKRCHLHSFNEYERPIAHTIINGEV